MNDKELKMALKYINVSAEFTYIKYLLDEILSENNSEKESIVAAVSDIEDSLNVIEIAFKRME